MKKLILIMVITFTSLTVNAQEKNKNKKVEFEVSGNCGMCKKRIEKAAYSVKGVKSADWHIDHKDIHLIIDETKTSIENVQKAIANAGHDNVAVKATDAVYNKMHECCKYRIQENH